MSKKLKKFLNDAEKTESKIAELEEYLRNVRAAQKKEEDNEIVRAIRSTKLGGRDLLALLENIQAGNVTFQTTVNNENKTSEEAEMEDADSYIFPDFLSHESYTFQITGFENLQTKLRRKKSLKRHSEQTAYESEMLFPLDSCHQQ